MSKRKKIILISLGCILGILIITNPSLSRFKDYGYYGRKSADFFLFSIYESETDHYVGSHELWHHSYIGIFGNFISVGSSY